MQPIDLGNGLILRMATANETALAAVTIMHQWRVSGVRPKPSLFTESTIAPALKPTPRSFPTSEAVTTASVVVHHWLSQPMLNYCRRLSTLAGAYFVGRGTCKAL